MGISPFFFKKESGMMSRPAGRGPSRVGWEVSGDGCRTSSTRRTGGQGANGLAKLLSDLEGRVLATVEVGERPRGADPQAERAGPGEPGPLRPRPVCPLEIAGHDRMRRAGKE